MPDIEQVMSGLFFFVATQKMLEPPTL